jgi:hypothetical protein
MTQTSPAVVRGHAYRRAAFRVGVVAAESPSEPPKPADDKKQFPQGVGPPPFKVQTPYLESIP